MYYLQSRYYNPEWGRFINADALIGQTGELLGHNLFVYCKNNVVNNCDPKGFKDEPSIGGGGGFIEVGIATGQMIENAAKRGQPILTRLINKIKYTIKNPRSLSKGAGKVAKIGDNVGNLGKLVKNPNITVNWGSAREHALNRMSKNGVTQEMFESWVKNGKAIQQDNNTYLFLTKDGVAVVSKNGIPQTAYTSAQFKDHINNAITQVYGK